MRGHCYDALVGLAGCDKSLPGLMMAMLRLNVPAVFMYGGSILPGRFKGHDVTIVDVFEGVGAHSVGTHDRRGSARARMRRLPVGGLVRRPSSPPTPWPASPRRSASPCPARPGRRRPMIRATPMPRRRARRSWSCCAGHCARATSSPARRSKTPRRWWRPPGGSTNAGLHLPAIAHEAGIDFDLHEVGEIFKRTPYIGDLKPGGRYVMKDLHDVGGVPMLMKALLDGGYLHGDCMTVTGKTIAENLARLSCSRPDRTWCARPRAPLSPTGGLMVLEGQSRAAGRHRQGRRHEGAAALPRAGALLRPRGGLPSPRSRSAQYKEGDVLVIRYEGPRGGPGMREMLSTTAALYGQGDRRQGGADHRRALLRRHARLLRSAMSGRRRRSAARSAFCATAT